jgi:O-antigen ligase
MSALSLSWALPSASSKQAVFTYAQLLGSVWVVRELARTREMHRRLLAAFCFGLYVPLTTFIVNFVVTGRASTLGTGLIGPGIAPALVIGIPIAYYLAMTSTGAVRILSLVYVPAALVVEPLTGGRTGFIAGAVSLVIMMLLAKHSRRSIVLFATVFVVALAVPQLLPQATWDRIAGIPAEITEGNMNYRRPIWDAGLAAFPQRPILGSGVGTYGVAVAELRQTFFNERLVAHQVFIGVLVEYGIVGFTLFVGLLVACALRVVRLPTQERNLWAVLMLNWLIQAQAATLEQWKITWLLFALLAAQQAVATAPATSIALAGAGAPVRDRPSSWAAGFAASSTKR